MKKLEPQAKEDVYNFNFVSPKFKRSIRIYKSKSENESIN